MNALYSSKKLVGLVNDFFTMLCFFDNKKYNKLIALCHAGIVFAIQGNIAWGLLYTGKGRLCYQTF